MNKIILCSTESRKAFDIFCILQKYKYKIFLVSKSSFIKRFFLSIAYKNKVHSYDKLANLDKNWFFFPVEEQDIEDFYSKGMKFKSKLPYEDIFKMSVNKYSLFEFCKKNNFRMPDTIQLKEKNLNSVDYPVYIKPNRGMGSRGVKKFSSLELLQKYLRKKTLSEDFLIQTAIESNQNIISGCFCSENGVITSYYSHKRLLTYPIKHGATVRSISMLDEQIESFGKEFIKKTNWSGLVMFEFMKSNKDDKYYLIEVNPRPWGSILLSEYCDSEMILRYVSKSEEHQNIKYGKSDRLIRWIFPLEIMHLFRGNISIKDFFDNACFINFHKTNFFRAVLFSLIFMFNLDKIFKK